MALDANIIQADSASSGACTSDVTKEVPTVMETATSITLNCDEAKTHGPNANTELVVKSVSEVEKVELVEESISESEKPVKESAVVTTLDSGDAETNEGDSETLAEPTINNVAESDDISSPDAVAADKLDADDTKAHDEQTKKEVEKVEKSVSELEEAGQERRYQQLVHLLERSSIYTSFLLHQMKGEGGDSSQASSEPTSSQESGKGGKKRSKRKKTTISSVIDKEEITKKRQRINEKGDDKVVVHKNQPKLLTGATLRDYQLYGVNWIHTLYDNGMNGILADEMGLGKTIQSIALIASLYERGVSGPFLVTVPLSTLSNWHREFQIFTPEIPVVLFHGDKYKRPKLYKDVKTTEMKIGDRVTKVFPVVITSYEMIILEHKFLDKFRWNFIIVDEGHRIKNLNCTLIKRLKAFHSDNRLLLTGTPLQNDLSELWSLLNFILPEVFNDIDAFQMWFDFSAIKEESDRGREKIIASEKEGQVLTKLHQILSPFLLRRLKTDVELEIPPKTEVHVYAPMTELQEQYYKAILERNIRSLLFGEEAKDENVLEKNEKGLRKKKEIDYTESSKVNLDADGFVDFSNCIAKDIYEQYEIKPSMRTSHGITKTLKIKWVQLKKCCNHPYMLKYPVDENGYCQITPEVLRASGKMLLLDRFLKELLPRGHKVLIFSTMTTLLDIIEDYLSLDEIGYCRLDGAMRYSDRDDSINNFRDNPNIKIFLLSTRAGGLGLNLMAADTVIIFDSDWNPQVDLQAQARAHRIGQKKKVMVYRFLAKDTIDQYIVEKAEGKRLLEKLVIQKGKFKTHGSSSDAISEQDLQELFNCDVIDALKKDFKPADIISDADLSALLDRENPLPKSSAYTVVADIKDPVI